MNKILAFASISIILLSACQKSASPVTEATNETPPTQLSTDSNAINAPIPKESINTALAVVGAPKYSVIEKSLIVDIEVKNNGTTALYGQGSAPVTLGVQIAGDDGTPDSNGGVRDFYRAAIPMIAPGQSATVVAAIPLDSRIENRKLRIDLVQEGVNWFEAYGQPVLEIGPFKTCDEDICDEAGAPLKR